MTKVKIAASSLIIILAVISGCGPPKTTQDICQNGDRYSQNFTAKEALFIRERNCSLNFGYLVSAFLIDKERGLFASAKHFVGSESDGQAKIFFNGKIYDGFLIRLPPISDVAIIKIAGNFDPADFPEPYRIAQNKKIGDKVFVRGIHPHPKQLIGDNRIIPLFELYYGLIGEPQTLVYESLEAVITTLNLPIKNKDLGIPSDEITSEVSSNYINLKMAKDHVFTFGGLSGGPTANERGEVIGINANQLPKDCVPLTENCIQQGELVLEGLEIKHRPFNELNIVPASELEKLLPLIADIK